MTRFVISLATVFALVPVAAAQDVEDTPTRASLLADIEARCDAMVAAEDPGAAECTRALRDARRTSSPVVVARIRRQLANDPLEATEAAVQEVDARDAYDFFDEGPEARAWASDATYD